MAPLRTRDPTRRSHVWTYGVSALFLLGGAPAHASKRPRHTELPRAPSTRAHRAVQPSADTATIELANEPIRFYGRAAVAAFEAAWNHTATERLRIVHLGDSHVQRGPATAELRRILQAARGNGGYGLFFPYSTARTYAPAKLSTHHEGAFVRGSVFRVRSAIEVGLVGYASATEDLAAEAFVEFADGVPPHATTLRAFCREGPGSHDLELSYGQDDAVSLPLTEAATSRMAMQTASLTPSGSKLRIAPAAPLGRFANIVHAALPSGRLECEGFSLESEAPGGVIVDSVGVGGAQFQSMLRGEHFVDQLAAIEPDVVVVDLGANDVLYRNAVHPELEGQIRALVGRIRAARADVTIVLATPQDMICGRRACGAAQTLSELLATVSRSEGCAFWDWFRVSGGLGSFRRWQRVRLASRDVVHLTTEGYRRKGRAMAEAFVELANFLRAHPESDDRWPKPEAPR